MNILGTESDGSRRAVSVGMFDGVHAGHMFLLRGLHETAKAHNLRSCAVTFSNHPLSVICPDAAPRMLSTPDEKLELLAEAGIDDCLILDFDWRLRQMSSEAFMRMLHDHYGAEILMLGFNNGFGSDRGLTADDYRIVGERVGIDVLQAPEFRASGRNVSSSAVRRAVEAGNVEDAAQLLGRCYTLTGTVVAGKQLGRTIGFPTANILSPCGDKMVPADGVYAARASMPTGLTYPAMVNIGHRPTVDSPDAPVSVEAHIIGFDGDIYGQPVTLEFVKFLRGEIRFPSVDALRLQLERDREQTVRLLSAGNSSL